MKYSMKGRNQLSNKEGMIFLAFIVIGFLTVLFI